MGDRQLAPFVLMGLKICDDLQVTQDKDKKIIMKFCKMYPPAKVAAIFQVANSFDWKYKNPGAAFMKAVGIVNKYESDKKQRSKAG